MSPDLGFIEAHHSASTGTQAAVSAIMLPKRPFARIEASLSIFLEALQRMHSTDKGLIAFWNPIFEASLAPQSTFLSMRRGEL